MKGLNGNIGKQNTAKSSSAFFHRGIIPKIIENEARRNVHYPACWNQNQRAKSEVEGTSPALNSGTNGVKSHAIERDVHQAEMKKCGGDEAVVL